MKKENQKNIFCTIKANTSYGQSVINSIEVLRDRFGLPTSRIIQDALLAYEIGTRNVNPPQGRTAGISGVKQQNGYELTPSDILTSGNISDYQM